jgi:hypothetical protein
MTLVDPDGHSPCTPEDRQEGLCNGYERLVWPQAVLLEQSGGA